MLESYRRVFAYRGAAAFSGTGLVARLPISMMTLGIVVLISELTDSYGLAGQVSAAFVIGNALFAIPHGRLADRFGQTKVLFVDGVLFALTSGLLVTSITDDWSNPLPHVLAVLSGATMPQIGSMVRGRWAHLVGSDQERHTAFAVESVVDEIVFVAGPAVVTFLSTVYAPETGLVVAVVLGTIGTFALATQTRTAPPAHPVTAEKSVEKMPWAQIIALSLTAVALGAIFGALEVGTVAVAEDAGSKASSGLLLGVFAIGSMVAGLAAGAVHWKSTAEYRFKTGIVVLAVGMVVLPFIANLALLAVVLFVVGTTLAPTLISMFSLLEASTPRSRLNEAMAVSQTGISGGLAPGAFLAGLVADHAHGPTTYWVAVGAGAFACLAAMSFRAAPAVDRDAAPVSD